MRTLLMMLLLLAACVNAPKMATMSANVDMEATVGNTVNGVLMLSKDGDSVRITGQIEGLTPGWHGFHIHEVGDCSSGDGKSAGGHYNPLNVEHGARSADVRHVGDLGNIQANEDGVALVDIVDKVVALQGGNSILGKAIIIHAGEDDYSQPTGAAGARVACGVIQV